LGYAFVNLINEGEAMIFLIGRFGPVRDEESLLEELHQFDAFALVFFSRPRNFGRLLMATQNGCCQVPRWEGFRFQFELQLGTKEILIS